MTVKELQQKRIENQKKINKQIQDLQEIREELIDIMKNCEEKHGIDCPALVVISQGK